MDAKRKRARDVYKILAEDVDLVSGDSVQTGMHRMGLPCDWRMAKGMFDVLAALAEGRKHKWDGDDKDQFVTLVEFDEALRQAVSEAERTLAFTSAYSHGEDKRKKFDLRVWLSQGKNRLKLAEVITHVYLEEDFEDNRVAQGGSKDDMMAVVAMELAELPCDPLTFASMRVVLGHVPCLRSEKAKRERLNELGQEASVTDVANEVNEAAELLYGNYLGPGMDKVVVEMNKKLAFLTRSLREESEALLECRIKASALEKDLSICKVRLDDSLAKNAEYGALLKLVRLRKVVARRSELGHETGTGYDIDVEGSLLINRNAKREINKAKADAEWWKQVNKCSAIRYQKIYMSDDKYRAATLARQYKMKWRRCQRRVWRLSASASWLQSEFNELSSVVERHVKRKLSLFEGQQYLPPPASLPSAAAAAAAEEETSPRLEGEDTLQGGQVGGLVTMTTQTTPARMGGAFSTSPVGRRLDLSTPQSLMEAKRKTNLNIAALQSLENQDEALLIKELGGQVGALSDRVEQERAHSHHVVGEKEGITLALRKRIAALEDSIIRESSGAYNSRVNTIRQQPYYTKSSRYGLTAADHDPFATPATPRNIYDRMRAFEQRMATTARPAGASGGGVARNLNLREFSSRQGGTSGLSRSQPALQPGPSPPKSALGLGSTGSRGRKQRSNSAFYQSEIYDLTKALSDASLQLSKKSNTIDRLSAKVVHTEEELTHVKGFIGKAHAAQAEYQGKIRDLRSESRDARREREPEEDRQLEAGKGRAPRPLGELN